MKKMTTLISSAILGSALTLGAVQVLDLDGQKVTIEHSDNLPVAKANYVNTTESPASSAVNFTFAAEKSTPAVVHIKATQTSSRRAPSQQYRQLPDPFRWFFDDNFFHNNQQRRGPQPRVASGSGVIINANGYIITNNHVIDQADDIEVSLYDKRSFKAEVVGTDPRTDLALLKIDEKSLPYLSLVNSDDVRVGEWVLAVGNPFNLASTVTAGIVSAKGRDINILKDQGAIENFIQTDAAVNPGNSGGALVNMEGDLVGINTAIASPTGAYSGYAFAVPSNIVNKVVEDLIDFGTVQRAYLGVFIREVDGKLADEMDLDVTEGVLVDSLVQNGSAKIAGLKKGDVIMQIDGRVTHSVPELQAAISNHRPGDEVMVTVNRKGKFKELSVLLKNDEGTTTLAEKGEAGKVLEVLGAEFEPLSKEEKRTYRLSSGVKVAKLYQGKLTRFTNIKEGFVITKIDGKVVNSVNDMEDALADKKGGVMLEGVYPGRNQIWYFAIGM